MSNLADRTKQIVKDEHKKVFKLTLKLWIMFFTLVGPIIALPILMAMREIVDIPIFLFVIIITVFLCSFAALIIHAKNNPYEPERKMYVILRINEQLISIGVNSIDVLEEIINEVENERRAIFEKEKAFFDRISKVIFLILLPLMAFLGKYVIESKILEIKNLNDVLSMTMLILTFTFSCVIVSLTVGNITEESNHLKKAELKRTKEYLIDIMYLYMNPNIRIKTITTVAKWKKTKSNQATADAAPQC